MLLLLEECGDVAREINHGADRDGRALNQHEYQDQLLHIAAVAVAALEDLGLEDRPGCLDMNALGMTEETVGYQVVDASPYPRTHWHRRLASTSVRELHLELALRWAFGVAHAKATGGDVGEFLTGVIASLHDDVLRLPTAVPDSVKPFADELVDVVGRDFSPSK